MRRAFPCLAAVMVLLGVGSAPAAAQEVPAKKACDQPEFAQFDFWVGDWEVWTEKGQKAGMNRIEKVLNGCAVRETWTGVRGVQGSSLNIYFAGDRKWHQTWVDSEGSLLELAGGFADGKMVLSGDEPKPDGTTVRHRITWSQLADGRVRQHWESSTDGGGTWKDLFVGLYRRLEPVPAPTR